MARYTTPQGVEVQTSQHAAEAVGYQPARPAASATKAPAKRGRPRKNPAPSDVDE